MDMSQYRDLFFSETREHLNKLSSLAVELEKTAGERSTIDALFREAHSIKGMAATMGFARTARLAHYLEDLLDSCRATGEVPSTTIDTLLAGIDLLEELLDDLRADRPERDIGSFLEPTPSAKAPSTPSLSEDIASDAVHAVEEDLPLLAVEIDEDPEIDQATIAQPVEAREPAKHMARVPEVFQVLIDLAEDTPASAARCLLILRQLEKSGELLTSRPTHGTLRSGAPCYQIQAWLRSGLARDTIAASVKSIANVVQLRFIEDRRKEERPREDSGRSIRIRTDLLDQFINLTGELITQRHLLNTASSNRNWDELTREMERTGRLIDDLHYHVLQSRLMPLESITGRLPRVIRDLSRKTGKQVTLQLSGTDVGLDRAILEELTDPLVHLVRNAVDHGIAETGTVTISARRDKDMILVEVADDGKGMDPGALRRKATERGLLTAEQAAALDDRDALMLVCLPGFSTAPQVTETSGRGVGMDVVKAAVKNLGGTLDIVSSPGQGSRFQLRLPLSVSIIRVLLVACGGTLLAIPLTRVLRAIDVPAGRIMMRAGRRVFRFADEDIPLHPLSRLLNLPDPPRTSVAWTILTEIRGRRIGLQVDRLLGHRKAFVKNLGFPLNRLRGLSGAMIEGAGRVVFIVDPQILLEDRQAYAKD